MLQQMSTFSSDFQARSSLGSVPNEFSPEEILTAFLLVESRRGGNSSWFPYLQSLPSTFTSPFSQSTNAGKLPAGLQRAFGMVYAIFSLSLSI